MNEKGEVEQLKAQEDVKTRLTQKLLEKLNAEPERVLFPKSNLR